MSPICLTLGRKDRPIAFPVAAIEELETETGKTIFQLLALNNTDLGLKTLVTMLHVGIKHGGGSDSNIMRPRIATMVERDFEVGTLKIQDVIQVVQRALIHSSTFKSQIPPEVIAEMEAAEAKGTESEGARPTESETGESQSNP